MNTPFKTYRIIKNFENKIELIEVFNYENLQGFLDVT